MLWFKPSDPNKLKLLIAFSGAYLLSITALHLLPEVFIGDDRGAYFGSFVLIGFFIQVMLEYLSEGIEHGHAHTHRSAGLPVGLMIGLCLHAFLEGMPLGGGDAFLEVIADKHFWQQVQRSDREQIGTTEGDQQLELVGIRRFEPQHRKRRSKNRKYEKRVSQLG